MNGNTAFKDTRLLEVLDHIDESYLAEALEGLKYPRASAAPAGGKGKILRSLKYVAAVAACALLMSTLIPVVQYVSGNLSSFLPSGGSESAEITTDASDMYTIELPNEVKNEILVAFLEKYNGKYNENDVTLECFGIFDDIYAVVFTFASVTDNAMGGRENINGLKFIYRDPKERLWLYKDGSFYGGLESYLNKLLPFSHFEEIFERYQNKYPELFEETTAEKIELPEPEYLVFTFDELEVLNIDEMKAIRNAFADYNYQKVYEYTYRDYREVFDEEPAREAAREAATKSAESARGTFFAPGNFYHSRYYGKISGCVILAHMGNLTSEKTYTLAGYEITFPYDATMYVYREGEIIEFQEAYEKGLLSDSDIATIAKRHELYNGYFKD